MATDSGKRNELNATDDMGILLTLAIRSSIRPVVSIPSEERVSLLK